MDVAAVPAPVGNELTLCCFQKKKSGIINGLNYAENISDALFGTPKALVGRLYLDLAIAFW